MGVNTSVLTGQDLLHIQNSSTELKRSINKLRILAGLLDDEKTPSLDRTHAAGLLIEAVLENIDAGLYILATHTEGKSGCNIPRREINSDEMTAIITAVRSLIARSEGLRYLGRLLLETENPGRGEQIRQLLDAIAQGLESHLFLIVQRVMRKHIP